MYLLQLEKYRISYIIKYLYKVIRVRKYIHIYSLIFLVLFIFTRGSMVVPIVYEILALYFFINDDIAIKIKLKFTPRCIRIICLSLVLYILTIALSFIICDFVYILLFTLIIFYLLYFSLALSIIILMPIEYMICNKYIHRAKKKLRRLSSLKVIAITGSYGKTSAKNILYNILKTKYNVVMTPKSFNTVLGITKSILSDIDEYTDIYIVEMGADRVGDISRLLSIVVPRYSILTSIGRQHMETFGSIENIIREKFTIHEYISDVSGVSILNMYNTYIFSHTHDTYLRLLKNRCKCKPTIIDRYTYLRLGYVTDGDRYYYYRNIETTKSYTKFDLYLDGKYLMNIKTRLIGKHNVVNIILAIAMGYRFGLEPMDISHGIDRVRSIESRMEVTNLESGGVIINNGYNSNIDSARSTLATLKLYQDKVKIVITPGLIECGRYSCEYNVALGEIIARVADIVYIVGKTNYDSILVGLKNKDFDMSKVIQLTSRKDWINMVKDIKGNEVILFENDLPDNFEV